MTAILFGAPANLVERHPGAALVALLLLAASAEWLADGFARMVTA